MELIKISGVAFLSFAILFILSKLMGNRQISEMTVFDYVMSITIGSIAAEMATELEKPLHGVVAMGVYAVLSGVISFFTAKSLKFRRLFFGKTIVLMKNGKFYRKNFKRAHLDISEFLVSCRQAGYFNLSDIDSAFLEPSGKVSFLPLSDVRPVNAKDLKVVPEPDSVFYTVISDGFILYNNLKSAGFDERWLNNELKVNGYKSEKDIFLATLDEKGTLNIFRDTEKTYKNDPFE